MATMTATATATSQRYHRLSITLHWLMLALIAAVYCFIEFRVVYDKGSPPRETMKDLHFMFGVLVFVLVWIRLYARLRWRAPAIAPAPAPPVRWLGHASHALLYLLMIAMPVAGYLTLSAYGDPTPFFGLELPVAIGENRELGRSLQDLHKLGGTIGYWLIGLHAAAALFHHYVLRDNVFLRMLPGRRGD